MLPGKTRLSAREPLPADLPIPVTLAARRQGHHRHQRCFCSVQTLRFVCCGIYRSPRIGVNHRLIWCALTRRDDVTMRRRSRDARMRLKKSKPNCRGLFHLPLESLSDCRIDQFRSIRQIIFQDCVIKFFRTQYLVVELQTWGRSGASSLHPASPSASETAPTPITQTQTAVTIDPRQRRNKATGGFSWTSVPKTLTMSSDCAAS